MSPEKHQDEELAELPPLDDDGSLFDDGEIHIEGQPDGPSDLDDATSEGDFGAFHGIDEQGSLLDFAEASDQLVIDEELLAGAEIGLLEDSDEGDGRDVTPDEAGVLADEGSDLDDGGVEGTGEDPAQALEAVAERGAHGEASDDEGIDDDARFEDGGAARARERLEREPWPPRADVSWTITRADALRFEGGSTSEGQLVVATRDGSLILSTDGGATFDRVPGCSGVTAATILDGVVIAALHDLTRDASAIVLVRDRTTAELVADFIADDADEDVRVESLSVRRAGKALEVLARGPFGGLLLQARGRG